ncbi:hypothetical protein VNO80_02074 [Phaseolus coccineus]|uniref:Uncharacterized protein n=1 Tax=Phaseolus coccineus TaxID=3886 RepID=A0AAN9NQH7_PHACN
MCLHLLLSLKGGVMKGKQLGQNGLVGRERAQSKRTCRRPEIEKQKHIAVSSSSSSPSGKIISLQSISGDSRYFGIFFCLG